MIRVRLSYKIMLRIKPLNMHKMFGMTRQHSSDSMCVWVCVCLFSHSVVTLCDPMDWAHEAPLSIRFSRQEYWSGLPFPPSGDLPNTGTEPMSPMSPAFADRVVTSEPPGLTQELYVLCSVARLYPILCYPMGCSLPDSSVLGGSPGKNAAVRCHALLQGIFPTQESNPGLPHCRWIFYPLSHQVIKASYF